MEKKGRATIELLYRKVFSFLVLLMSGHKFCVCGSTQAQDSSVSFHRIPKKPERRSLLFIFNILFLKFFILEIEPHDCHI